MKPSAPKLMLDSMAYRLFLLVSRRILEPSQQAAPLNKELDKLTEGTRMQVAVLSGCSFDQSTIWTKDSQVSQPSTSATSRGRLSGSKGFAIIPITPSSANRRRSLAWTLAVRRITGMCRISASP